MHMVTNENASEEKLHHWVTEASTLGLRPGEVPSSMETDLGNRRPFLLVEHRVQGSAWMYQQEFGCIFLTVFND